MKIISGSISKNGSRIENQDCVCISEEPDYGFWVVTDGLGGHAGGRIAATSASNIIRQTISYCPEISGDAISKYLESAHMELKRFQTEYVGLKYMSTAVLLISDYETAMWGHIGDSRLYFFRKGKITHQTKDHSYSQAKANAGVISNAQIRKDADRNRLLKVLGMKGSIFPDILREPLILQVGDAILLCTDGFWENVTEENMEKALGEANSPQEWLEIMETWICRSGNELDNYSAIGLMNSLSNHGGEL